MRIVVLGAGVIGVASAYWLMRAGHQVTVFERQSGAGLETSWGNGGIVHVSSVEPWSAPGVPRKVLGWIGNENAPMLLRLGALPFMWRWGLEFLRNCTPDAHRRNALHTLELALESLQAMQEIRTETGIEYGYKSRAVLKVYATDADLRKAASTFATLEPHGLQSEVWDAATCVAREPALSVSANKIAGGIFFPQDEIGDCNRFCQAIAVWCEERGAVFRYGTTVGRIVTDGGKVSAIETSAGHIEVDAIVVALGSYSPALVRPLGIRIAVYPVKGVSLTAPREAWPEAPHLALMDDLRKVAYAPIGDHLRVVGTAEVARFDTKPDSRRVAAIADRLCELLPGFRACIEHPQARPWAGLRPVVPDGRPLIGPTAVEGLWLNTGHGHGGWTMAAGSGRRLAGLIGESAP